MRLSWPDDRPTLIDFPDRIAGRLSLLVRGSEGIIAAIEQHFSNAMVDVRNRVDALMTNVTKPRLMLIKK
jgi:hypothetical protein